MHRYLLDTNVVSELSKEKPNMRVVQFVASLPEAWLSVITLHEIEYGIGIIPHGKKRIILESFMQTVLQEYQKNILPLQQEESNTSAELRAMARNNGKTLTLADALIAGTAKVHSLTVATRNTKDFEGYGVEVFNPFL